MKRREFVKQGTVSVIGLSLFPTVISCTSKSIDLSILLNTKGELLQSFKRVGNSNFGYYQLSDISFNNQIVKGENAFIYIKDSIIVGFTIRKDGVEQSKPTIDKLTQQYGNPKLIYDNSFGKKYSWNTQEKEYYLSYTKNIPNLLQYTFYSEAIKNNGLIVL